jgi:hypothetical protein
MGVSDLVSIRGKIAFFLQTQFSCGKIISAEIGLILLFSKKTKNKCVILNAGEESVNQGKRFEHSSKRFLNLADSSLSLGMTFFLVFSGNK